MSQAFCLALFVVMRFPFPRAFPDYSELGEPRAMSLSTAVVLEKSNGILVRFNTKAGVCAGSEGFSVRPTLTSK
ncbi:hypothetical protein MLD38_003047 [Melastoma candidum]|uniref:Uncharacterized protein n=1 Tax=Melastoma candidum TaxID=119954 RepID=A0ACB9S4H2_9MYRT|nr:hypothetical protein MLD38_003047 [Melastoma candidum]